MGEVFALRSSGASYNLLFQPHQIIPRLAPPDFVIILAFHQHFGGARAAVVVRRHAHAIRARIHDQQPIAARDLGQFPIGSQRITGFTHRPHDVGHQR